MDWLSPLIEIDRYFGGTGMTYSSISNVVGRGWATFVIILYQTVSSKIGVLMVIPRGDSYAGHPLLDFCIKIWSCLEEIAMLVIPLPDFCIKKIYTLVVVYAFFSSNYASISCHAKLCFYSYIIYDNCSHDPCINWIVLSFIISFTIK